MRKGIFQDFDGYDQVVKDIESSRRWGTAYSADTHGADRYIDLLHPARVRVRNISPCFLTSMAFGPPGPTVFRRRRTRLGITTLRFGGWRTGWFPIIYWMTSDRATPLKAQDRPAISITIRCFTAVPWYASQAEAASPPS